MTLSRLSFIISFILSTPLISGQKLYNPALSLQRQCSLDDPESIIKDIKNCTFTQTLDHFNYIPKRNTTFEQRYMINEEHWGGAKSRSPIFVYLGAESPIDQDPDYGGFMSDNAAQFKALLVYIEHRFYGESIPLGMSFEQALKDKNIRGYFNSAQALADYAAIIVHLKQEYNARYSPVIVVGESYGGMLASWFRLKYPHLTIGALASSAPILYFDDITPKDAYYSVIAKDFKETSETCFQTIRDSWSEIDRVAGEPHGIAKLSEIFLTCNPLKNGQELKSYLRSSYEKAALYDYPPWYPVTAICDGIDREKATENRILRKIFAGVVANEGISPCYVNPTTTTFTSTKSQTELGWGWQRCSEMVMPIAIPNDSMFEPSPFNLSDFIAYCEHKYGVTPRPHWITTYYGGKDMELILRGFGSNIIFSNGLRDPYSAGGVLKNISHSIVAIYTEKGSHCLDTRKKMGTDPKWLRGQRETEVNIIKGWIESFKQ